MRFLILAATDGGGGGGGDGISPRATECATVEAACGALGWARPGWPDAANWPGLAAWAADARPGDIYYTHGKAIVAAPDECLSWPNIQCPCCKFCGSGAVDYGDYVLTSRERDVELRAECPECHGRWVDVFMLADRRELPADRKHNKKTKKK